MPKTVDELTFTDDGMFQAVMHDPTICAELVERLLHIHVKQINYPKLEKQIAPFYTELKDSYILFICKEDPFHDENNISYGLPCYTFQNSCIEDGKVKLHDNSFKVIYNASAYVKKNSGGITPL